ncbi:acetylcholinesterase-like [Oppia nitens]|uniref:acetylcholinesterase-like n=1 Tax=Oppia nitens TaxID=1686743 RepID=UPI0023D9C3A3|nr:acetylcholinesterase-like [Oppia nitens]
MLLKSLVVLLLLITLSTTVIARDVSVTIENGQINGRTQTFNGTELEVYLGIPYAEPPVGALRFRRPVSARKWSKPFNAYQWPNACPQQEFGLPTMYNKNRSEDCLQLNVFTANSSVTTNPKPVMVWIHGGAFIMGSSSEMRYNLSVLATMNVVVVSINYRLGMLGMLYTGTDDAPGNMAFWDQILALEWVHNNIRHFGGDPQRVTLFGQSAGSISVNTMIMSPKSRHLFKNAIAMSGSPLIHGMIAEPAMSLKYWLRQAKAVGCSTGNNHQSDNNSISDSNYKMSAKVIECLRQIPANKLTENYTTFEISGSVDPIFVIDGTIYTGTVMEMLERGEHKHNFSLMISNTEDEGSILLASLVDSKIFNPFSPKNFTYGEAYDYLSNLSAGLSANHPIDGQQVSRLYFTGLSNRTDRETLIGHIGIAYGDYLMTCPTIRFGRTLSAANKPTTGVAVYQYYYNSRLGNEPKEEVCTKWMGVCHGLDLWPVFGIPFLNKDKYADREREISGQMMQIFTNFAKFGNPGIVDNYKWPQFYSMDSHVIAPYYEFSNQPNPVTNYKNDLKIDFCQYLWDSHNQ